MKQYRTLIYGKIRQKTALNIGGSDQDSSSVMTFRNGDGLLTIPATSLAGAFVETAMRLFPDFGKQHSGSEWKRVSGKLRNSIDNEFFASVFNFENMHTVRGIFTEMRQGVGIDAVTGTSADGALFETEVVPAGTEWGFFLEIDTFRGGDFAEAIALMVLGEWQAGYGWLGKNNARGCGWFEFLQPEVLKLSTDCLDLWPDSSKPVLHVFDDLKKQSCVVNADFEKIYSESSELLKYVLKSSWHYLSLKFAIKPGESDDGYGYDAIQSGGHEALPSLYDFPDVQNKFLPPHSLSGCSRAYLDNLSLDKPFPVTVIQNRVEPFLPGSSIRGALRSVAAKHLRGAKEKNDEHGTWGVFDPNRLADEIKKKIKLYMSSSNGSNEMNSSNEEPSRGFTPGKFEELFGIDKMAGKLLISDARLKSQDDYLFLSQEQHAEDEFTAGVFGSGKFNSTVLLSGSMEFEIVIEGCSKEEVITLYQVIEPALNMAVTGWVPLGGGKNKGAGWLPWRLVQRRIRKIATLSQRDAVLIEEIKA